MIAITLEHKLAGDVGYRLEGLKDLVRKGLVDPKLGTLPVQCRLLCEDIMAKTPPTSKGVTNDTNARRVGETAIRNDITRLFHPLWADQFEHRPIKKIVAAANLEHWNRMSPYLNGRLRGTHAVIPSMELHTEFRNKRGRIPKSLANRPRFVTLEPHHPKIEWVIKRRLAWQGWARAGWLTAYMGLGGVRAPQWVLRHAPGKGAFHNGTNDPVRPYIGVSNTTRWSRSDVEAQRIVNNALARRAASIKKYADKMAELAIKGIATPYQREMMGMPNAQELAAVGL